MAMEVREGPSILSEGLKLFPLGQKLSKEGQKGKAPNRLHGEAPVLVTRTMLGSYDSLGSFQCSAK